MNKKQTERILIGVVAAILVLYGIYQVAYGKSIVEKDGSVQYNLGPFEGWNKTSGWIQLTPKLEQQDTNDQRIEYNIINESTWNIVNSTDGSTATVSFDFAPPGCSYNGSRDCSYVITWWDNNLTLNGVDLTFKTVSKDHIELQDSHGNIIHMIRQQHVQETPESMRRNLILRLGYAKTVIPNLRPTINFTTEPTQDKECSNCAAPVFILSNIMDHFLRYHTYKGYYSVGDVGKNDLAASKEDQLVICAHAKDFAKIITASRTGHKVNDCTYLMPSNQK